MPPIRDYNVIPDDAVDDDADPDSPHQQMLPNPSASMTYTFLADMTPLSLAKSESGEPSTSALPPPAPPRAFTSEYSPSIATSSPASPLSPEEGVFLPPQPRPTTSTRAHGKKRDASYIPRPPNAFILFRSSFIRSQQVPGKVEGNHSNLSKIIGKVWNALPPHERDEWESKALDAQEEHRRKYPHWRFRPGSNTGVAKQKARDRSGSGASSGRGRGSKRGKQQQLAEIDEADEEDKEDEERQPRVKDSGKGKGRAKAKAKTREDSLEDARCNKIVELISEGLRSEELETALEEWEKEEHEKERSGVGRVKGVAGKKAPTSKKKARASKEPPSSSPSASSTRMGGSIRGTPGWADVGKMGSGEAVQQATSSSTTALGKERENDQHFSDDTASQSRRTRSPDRTPRGDASPVEAVPLTHMFKRSISAPAPNSRSPHTSTPASPSDTHTPRQQPQRTRHLKVIVGSHSSATSSPALPSSYLGQQPVTRDPQRLAHAQVGVHHAPHDHLKRDVGSFSINESNYNPAPSTLEQHLSQWDQKERERHTYGPERGQNTWWDRPEMDDSPNGIPYSPDHCEEASVVVTTDGMGYEAAGSCRYEHAFIEDYQTCQPGGDSGRLVCWDSNPGRQGQVALISDPFAHESKVGMVIPPPTLHPSSPTLSLSTPVTASPGMSEATSSTTTSPSNLFYPPLSPDTPKMLPSSSYSTLSGWAGNPQPINSLSRPFGWFNEPGWDYHQRHILPPTNAEEWDQMELGGNSNSAEPHPATKTGFLEPLDSSDRSFSGNHCGYGDQDTLREQSSSNMMLDSTTHLPRR